MGTPNPVDEIQALTETFQAWRDEQAKANETRVIVEELQSEFQQVLRALETGDLPGLRDAVERMERKLDEVVGNLNVMIRFFGLLVQQDKETLTLFREMARDSLGTGDIVAGRDVSVKKEGGK